MRRKLGRRYGGSSSVKAEASPRRIVRVSTHDTTSVKIAPSTTIASTEPAATSEATAGGNAAATNTVASMISVGKRPLHGTKLLVRIATSRSRGESITRVAMMPAALQPKPIAIDSACLPCAPARLEQVIEVERHARQVAEVLEDREQRKEDRHRRQHHADHPRQAAEHAVPDEAGQPPRGRRSW